MGNIELAKNIDTCNGDDLSLSLGYMEDDNSSIITLSYRDAHFDIVSEKKRHKHEHHLLFTPELAVKFANTLLDFAKSGFVHNVTEEQKQLDELRKICPF